MNHFYIQDEHKTQVERNKKGRRMKEIQTQYFIRKVINTYFENLI